jgi:hypothetical protein
MMDAESSTGPGTVMNAGMAMPRLIRTLSFVAPEGTRNTSAIWWSPGSGSAGTVMVAVTTCEPPAGISRDASSSVSHWAAEYGASSS